MEKKSTSELTTSTRLLNEVLGEVKRHVAEKGVGIAPARFFELAARQVIRGYSTDWTFKVGDKIKDKKNNYICICADACTAIFAPYVGKTTKYSGMIGLSNMKIFADTHTYKRIN